VKLLQDVIYALPHRVEYLIPLAIFRGRVLEIVTGYRLLNSGNWFLDFGFWFVAKRKPEL